MGLAAGWASSSGVLNLSMPGTIAPGTIAPHGTLKIDSYELPKVMIPFPSLKEQRRIVAAIDSIAEETRRIAAIYVQKLAALDELKKSLLHQAFSGRL